MISERDLRLPDGRLLHVYDTGDPDGGRLPVCWQHGSPNIGSPPQPLFTAADRLGLRWIGHDRPGYGGSTRRPDRTAADTAADVAAVVDALGVDRFAVMGHSGGGPHALACAALLGDRVLAAVAIAGLAPYDAAGLDFFAGMAPAGVASMRAAAAGRASRERYEQLPTPADIGFTAADEEALTGRWSWLLDVVGPAVAGGPAGMIDDDLSAVAGWGFDPAAVTAPVLLLHGGRDRMVPAAHSRWLAARCPAATLRISPDDGHLTVLDHAESALTWLAGHRRPATG